RAFLSRVTRLSPAHLTRLIRQYRRAGTLPSQSQTRRCFPTTYTRERCGAGGRNRPAASAADDALPVRAGLEVWRFPVLAPGPDLGVAFIQPPPPRGVPAPMYPVRQNQTRAGKYRRAAAARSARSAR